MRKGFIFDQIFALIIIFGLAISVVMLFLMAGILPSGYYGLDQGKEALTKTGSMVDNMFPIMAIGLMFMPVISAFFARSHPIFLIFSIFGMVVNTFFSWMVKEMFLAVASADTLLAYSNQAPFTIIIMQNINIIGMLLGGLTFLVLVMKGAE